MNNVLLIGIGSGIGGIFRYLLSSIVYQYFGRTFPYGTLIVNAVGCLVMGFLFVILLERFDGIGSQLRAFLLIGFLGGFTTFSSFSIETLNLFENGQQLFAFLNIMVSVILCLSLTWLGMLLGRQ
ncbi:MAG: fluoride efflux transporter CrcB [Gammaproteobacteria bacterium]|nr:fluoride efflux transporter CrcB [Gammaproteobacteria bacterium]